MEHGGGSVTVWHLVSASVEDLIKTDEKLKTTVIF